MNGRSVNACAERAWTPLRGPTDVTRRVEPETRSRPAGSSGGRRPGRGPRTGRRPAAGSRRGRPSRPATRPTADAGDPDRRLLHAAEERPEAELARALEHRLRGTDAAALGELDVDARHDADERVEVLGRDRALVGDDRQRRALLEPAEVAIGASRERLLDQLDAEVDELGQEALGVVARPAGVGVDPDRPVEDLADRPKRREVVRPAALDLERREGRRARGALGDDRRARRCRS